MTSDIVDPLIALEGHQKKVHIVQYHKVAENLLTTASHDHTIRIWDLAQGTAFKTFDNIFTDTIWSVSWNRQGNLFAASSKDKMVRIVDPRGDSTVASVRHNSFEREKKESIIFFY
jgi:WD40 repeat protein